MNFSELKTISKNLKDILSLLIFLLVFLFPEFQASAQNPKIDSLLNLLKTDKEDTNKVNHLNALGRELMYSVPDTSIILGNQALALCDKLSTIPNLQLKISNFKSYTYRNLGVYYYFKSDYPKALNHYLKALKMDEELGNKKGVASSLGNIGNVYRELKDYPNALNYYLKAFKIGEIFGYQQLQANNLANIGVVYDDQKNYSKALNYYLKALKINGELGSKNLTANTLGNIASIYGEKKDYTNSLYYYLKALKIDEELGEKNGMAIQLANIGSIYTKTAGNLTTLKLREARYKSAEQYLKKAISMNDSIGALNNLRQTEEMLSNLYSQTNLYQLALKHYEKSRIVKDSIFNEEKSKDIGKLEAKHEIEMTEIKRKQEEEEKTRQMATVIGRRNKLQYSGIFIFLVFLIIVLLLIAGKNISIKIVEGVIFLTFLLFFEFLLVLLDPFMGTFTGGVPLYKLIFNATVAGVIFPVHRFFEGWVKRRLFISELQTTEPSSLIHPFMFFLFTGLPYVFFGFNNNTDSLKIKLEHESNDTNRIKLLNELAWFLQFNNPDTSILLSEQALNISKNKKWEKGIANCYQQLGVFLNLKGEHELSLKYFEKGLFIWRKLKNKKAEGSAIGNIGTNYLNRSEYNNALENFFKALSISEDVGYKLLNVNMLNNIGTIFNYKGDYPRALEYYYRGLKISKEMGLTQIEGDFLGNIGVVYSYLHEKKNALKSFIKAFQLSKKSNNKNRMSLWLQNMGSAYFDLMDFNNALNSYTMALMLSAEISDKNGEASNYIGRGNVYMTMNNDQKGLVDYHTALRIFEEIGSKRGIILSRGNIGTLYLKLGKKADAEKFFHSGLGLAIEIEDLQAMKELNFNLCELYKNMGSYQLALKHFKKSCIAKDSLFNEEKSKEIGKLEAKHEYELAEVKRKQQEEEKRRQETAVVERRNSLQYSGIFIFIVFVFSGILFSGKLHIPVRVAEGLTFFVFLLLFEFLLVWMDPYIESITGGEPLYKLIINAIVAAVIFPLHGFFEGVMKKRLMKRNKKKF